MACGTSSGLSDGISDRRNSFLSLRRAVVRRLLMKWSLRKPKTSQKPRRADGLRYFVGIIRRNIAISFQTKPATSVMTRRRQKRRQNHEDQDCNRRRGKLRQLVPPGSRVLQACRRNIVAGARPHAQQLR